MKPGKILLGLLLTFSLLSIFSCADPNEDIAPKKQHDELADTVGGEAEDISRP